MKPEPRPLEVLGWESSPNCLLKNSSKKGSPVILRFCLLIFVVSILTTELVNCYTKSGKLDALTRLFHENIKRNRYKRILKDFGILIMINKIYTIQRIVSS